MYEGITKWIWEESVEKATMTCPFCGWKATLTERAMDASMIVLYEYDHCPKCRAKMWVEERSEDE